MKRRTYISIWSRRAELRFEALLFLMMFILTEKRKGSNIKLIIDGYQES